MLAKASCVAPSHGEADHDQAGLSDFRQSCLGVREQPRDTPVMRRLTATGLPSITGDFLGLSCVLS